MARFPQLLVCKTTCKGPPDRPWPPAIVAPLQNWDPEIDQCRFGGRKIPPVDSEGMCRDGFWLGLPHSTNIHREFFLFLFIGFTCLVRHAVGHHDLWPTQLILTMASRMGLFIGFSDNLLEPKKRVLHLSWSAEMSVSSFISLRTDCRSLAHLTQSLNGS